MWPIEIIKTIVFLLRYWLGYNFYDRLKAAYSLFCTASASAALQVAFCSKRGASMRLARSLSVIQDGLSFICG